MDILKVDKMRMSTTINKITIKGFVGKDPAVRYTGSGKAIVSFDVADNDRSKSAKSGRTYINTKWHKIVALNQFAQQCIDTIKKGDFVVVVGEQHDREGKNKYHATIKIVEIILFSDDCSIEVLN